MQEAQYNFLHGQTDRSDFFSPAMQQLCGIMKDNQVALPSDIGEGYFRYISPCPNIEMYICDVKFYRDTVLREQVYKDSFSVIFSLSDALEWKASGRNQKTLLEKGDCCVCLRTVVRARCSGERHSRVGGVQQHQPFQRRLPKKVWMHSERI